MRLPHTCWYQDDVSLSTAEERPSVRSPKRHRCLSSLQKLTFKSESTRAALLILKSLYNWTWVGVSVPAKSAQVPNSHLALRHTNTSTQLTDFLSVTCHHLKWQHPIGAMYWSPTQRPSVKVACTFAYAWHTHTHTWVPRRSSVPGEIVPA